MFMNIGNITNIYNIMKNGKIIDISIKSCFMFMSLAVKYLNVKYKYFLNTMNMVLFQNFSL